MRRGWLAAGLLAAAIGPASAGPGAGLAGYWWNLDPTIGPLSHVVVTTYAGGIGMQAFGYCGAVPFCPLGEGPAHLPQLGTVFAVFTDKVPSVRTVTLTLTDATHLTFKVHTLYTASGKQTDQSGTMTKEPPGFVGPENPYH